MNSQGATKVTVNPQVQSYQLPLAINEIANLDRDVREKEIHAVDTPASQKLSENGFVVVPTKANFKRFSEAFNHLNFKEVPVFVSADSVLHLYHLFFDQILKYLEVKEFPRILILAASAWASAAIANFSLLAILILLSTFKSFIA